MWKINDLKTKVISACLILYFLLFLIGYLAGTGFNFKFIDNGLQTVKFSGNENMNKEGSLFYWLYVFEVLGKELQVSGVESAIINAYISNVYSRISDESQANLAMYRFLLRRFPHSEIYLKSSLGKLTDVDKNLSADSLKILNTFVDKFERESQEVYIKNNAFKATGYWRIQIKTGEPRKPEMPGAGVYSRFLVDDSFVPLLSKPGYVINSNILNNEITLMKKKLVGITRSEEKSKLENVLFWNAGRGSQSLSYIWQKILADHSDGDIENEQRKLAEIIADTYIISYQEKYKFQTQRIDQIIKGVDFPVKVPKSPGFPSDIAAVCTVSYFFLKDHDLKNKAIYKKNYDKCIQSRMDLGLDFSEDVKYGKILGEQIYDHVKDKL